MKKVFVVIGLLVVLLIFSGCAWVSALDPFKNLPQFALSDESVKYIEGLIITEKVSMTISYQTTDENDSVARVVLADGLLVEGELKFNQKVTEPTEVLVSVKYRDNDESAEMTALITPEATNNFVYIYGFEYLILKGEDHRSIDKNKRFSITGNLGEIVGFEPSFLFDPSLVQVSVQAKPSFIDLSGKALDFGPVLLDDGEFSIDGDLEEPTLVSIKIFKQPSFLPSVKYLPAVLEPGVNYRVVPLGENGEWTVEADRESLHSKLVSSWQTGPEYVSLIDEWMDDRAENREEKKNDLNMKKHLLPTTK